MRAKPWLILVHASTDVQYVSFNDLLEYWKI